MCVLSVILGTSLYAVVMYNSDLLWNHTWYSAQWRALCTEITEVNYLNLSADCFMKISLHSSGPEK